MTRYKIILEYNGSGLIGWQANKDGPSVQSLVTDAIFKFSGQVVDLVACGRTDAGVHACGMPAHFDLDNSPDANTVLRAVNFYLKHVPIKILECEIVPDDFHARFDCKMRHYKYVVLNRNVPPVLDQGRVHWVPRKLDVSKMQTAAVKLVGHHDFTSFRASECQAKNPVRTLDVASVYEQNSDHIIFEFSARGFLHHQVRNMVGTLIEIGLCKDFDIDEIFNARDRRAAGPTVSSDGLYFVSADY